MESGPSVEAIVVTHDSEAVLPGCLDAFQREGIPVLVVDNASRDGTPDLAERRGARVVRSPVNLGYGRANNLGMRESRADYVLVANPDLQAEAGLAMALRAAARRYPDAGLLAPRILEPDGRFFFQSRSLLSPYLTNPAGLPCRPEGDACAPFLSGACLMGRRDLLLELGGFDERIFLFYEDDDLCRRVADRGLALVHVHDAVVRHRRGASSSPKPGRIFASRWHQAWSRAYVSRKYGLPDPAPGMAALNGLKALGACLTGRRSLIERYAGSAAGAWAALRGRPAFPGDPA